MLFNTIHCLVCLLHKILRVFAVIRIHTHAEARRQAGLEPELFEKSVAVERAADAFRDGNSTLPIGVRIS